MSTETDKIPGNFFLCRTGREGVSSWNVYQCVITGRTVADSPGISCGLADPVSGVLLLPVVRLLNKVLFSYIGISCKGDHRIVIRYGFLAASCFLLSADLDVSAVCFTDSDHSSADLVGSMTPKGLIPNTFYQCISTRPT